MPRRSLPTRFALAAATVTAAVAGLVAPAALATPTTPSATASAPASAARSAVVPGARPATRPASVTGSPYVALGDSYTASPLTGPLAGGPPACLRSTNNYPHLVAASTGDTLTDVSCSGAQTRDFASAQAVRGGENPPQYDALTSATRLVTVGIGGNDIGFGDIVRACVSPTPFGTPCRDRYAGKLEPRIDALRPTLLTVLKEVHRRSPHARVLLVGYPAILPATGPGCYPVVPYTAGDVAYLRTILGRLDGVISSAAAGGSASYVDTYTPTVGHDICQLPGAKWIEGLIPTSPAAPAHPNALGAAALSRAVLATLGVSPSAS